MNEEKEFLPDPEIGARLKKFGYVDKRFSTFGCAMLRLAQRQSCHFKEESPDEKALDDAESRLCHVLRDLRRTKALPPPLVDALELAIFDFSEALSAPYRREKENRENGLENSEKARTVKEAQIFAMGQWNDDPTIRTGVMVERTRQALKDKGFVLPRSDDRIRAWISVVAPSLASAPGRPKKTE